MRIKELSFWNGKEYLIARPELLESVLAAIEGARSRYSARLARVAIEIGFSRRKSLAHDLLRFLAAYNDDKIDLGVLVTNTRQRINRFGSKPNGPSFEDVSVELSGIRRAFVVPIWLIGLM